MPLRREERLGGALRCMPPPWRLSSPFGEIFTVENEMELKTLAVAKNMINKARKNKLKELIAADQIPIHEGG